MSRPFKQRRGLLHGINIPDLCTFLLGDFLQDVDDVENGRCGDQNDLEDPEAQVGDGSERVVADVVAAGLQGVAGELGLFVAVHGIAHQGHQHDAEDEQHRQPNLANNRGMVLDFCEETTKDGPVPHFCGQAVDKRLFTGGINQSMYHIVDECLDTLLGKEKFQTIRCYY